MNDKHVIKQIQKGNVRAYARIYDKYVARIYRYVFLKVSSKEETEDLTSQVFTKSLDFLIQGDKEIKNLNAFLYQVANNLIIDFYRQRARSAIAVENEIMESLPDEQAYLRRQAGQEIKSMIDSDMQSVKNALQQIKDEYQEAVILYYLEELTTKEISKIMDKSPDAVRQLIHRGLEALREHLDKKIDDV